MFTIYYHIYLYFSYSPGSGILIAFIPWLIIMCCVLFCFCIIVLLAAYVVLQKYLYNEFGKNPR